MDIKNGTNSTVVDNGTMDTDESVVENGALKADGEKEVQCSKLAISGFDGVLNPVFRTFQFTLDFNVFNSLVEATYRHISNLNYEYSKNISMGMFSYYCSVALWYRLFAVRHAQGGDPEWWFAVLKLADIFVLPKPISEFLDLVGDFVEPNQNFYWKLVFPSLNRSGHFGKMTAASFYKYMAYPAPAVLIETLRQELSMLTGKTGRYSKWRLKEIDCKDINENAVFTKNVCGYNVPFYASMFDIEVDGPIGKQLSQTFAEGADAGNIIDGLLVYDSLLEYVAEYHQNNDLNYPIEEYSNESQYGSIVQMGFVESSAAKREGNCGEYFSSDVQGFSPVMLPSSSAHLIPILRLRVRRASCVDAYPYDFETDADIPTDWPKHLNDGFDFGDARSCWNCGKFSTGSIESRRAISHYVSSFTNNV